MAEGLRITMAALPGGLTVDKSGKKLLQQKFTFQCPPLEEFKVVRAFTMTNYDTIDDGQYTRRGSRQLKTWQFDTLLMEVGVNADGTRVAPGWIPYPHFDRPGVPVPPEWYVQQIAAVHDAGCPFQFVAQFPGVGEGEKAFARSGLALGPIIAIPAVLLGMSETHKAGEGDSIYLEGLSFSEWRDPVQSQRGLGSKAQHHGRPSDTPPTKVTLERNGVVITEKHRHIPSQHSKVKVATLAMLSKFFYHSPSHWREIADANSLKGGGPTTPLTKFKRFAHIPKNGTTLKIPELPPQKHHPTVPKTGGARA